MVPAFFFAAKNRDVLHKEAHLEFNEIEAIIPSNI